MSAWTFDYAMNQARLVLRDSGKLHSHEFVENVLTPLVAKLDEQEKNPGVWDGAPDNADRVELSFWSSSIRAGLLGKVGEKQYTRTLPKTKAREIAERTGHDLATAFNTAILTEAQFSNIIESAINEALGDKK
jgi:hypothetical protein